MRKILGIIIAFNIFALLVLNFYPYPENFIYSYLASNGFLPYKQILDQHFPGLLFLPINFYTLGMRTPESARLWLIGTVILDHILIYLISRKVFDKSKRYLLIPNVIYALSQPFFEGYVFWIDSIAPIFLLLGAYFLINQEKKDLKLKDFSFSGLFLGIGIVFKQIFLPITGLVFLYLFLREKGKQSLSKQKQSLASDAGKPRVLVFLFFPVLFLVLLFVYMKGRGVWEDFYFWTIKFNLTTFAELGRKYPSVGDLVKAGLVFGLSGIGWLYLLVKNKSHNKGVLLFHNKIILGLFFMGGLLFAYARFDFVHLQPALPFSAVILVLFFLRLPKNRYFYTGLAVWGLLCLVLLVRFYLLNIGNKVYFWGEGEARMAGAVEKYVKPGDSIFAFATTPHIYFLTNTYPAGRILVFNFPWFMIEARERVLAGIVSDPPKVILKNDNAVIDGKRFIDYMGDISFYIEKNYKTVDIIEGTKVMIPR